MHTDADVIIVGAGGSGATLAARLSEDAHRKVLVLEAGPAPRFREDFPADLLDARRVPGAVDGSDVSWWYAADLSQSRPYRVSRGRYLGGSTTTNGGYFQRPRRTDFERWSLHGGEAWSYDAMLPLMRAIETDADFPHDPLHGLDGPMPVRRTALDHPAVEALHQRASTLGLTEEPDKNGEQTPGFGPVPTNTRDGVRWNTGIAYLLPARVRTNLDVLGGVRVRRVLTKSGRAVGVEIEHDHKISEVYAEQVVLCAGAYATPHLLMLSGIGPADTLAKHGIAVHVDLPGVGDQIEDHPQLVLNQRAPFDSALLKEPDGSWLGAGVNTHLDDGADLEVLQSLVPMRQLRGLDSEGPLPLLVSVRSAAPAGRISLLSADPDVLPHVQYDYLATGDARRRLREAVRFAAEVAGLPPMGDDATVDQRVAGHLGTAAHACGGASFATGVTDAGGRVAGVEGLRVADTSLLPGVPSRGPAATAVLIGEYVASRMRHG